MKKALSLILCIVFIFSFAACKEKEEKPTTSTPIHTVDVKKYVDAGEFDTVEYKLGADVEQVKEKLQQITDDHGHESYNENENPDTGYTSISAGEYFCRYKTDQESKGISYIAINNGAFGFEKGTTSTKVREGMATLGYSATLREIKDGEFFGIPRGASAEVLEYQFEKNKLALSLIKVDLVLQ